MTRSMFEIAGGSVIGTYHRRNGDNNQDAYVVYQDDSLSVGIVCDGCSDSKYSEVGARIGSNLILTSLVRQLKRSYRASSSASNQAAPNSWSSDRRFWERVERDVTAALHVLVQQMGESLTEQVTNHLLFTTIGVIITPGGAVFFSLGDGIIIVNGQPMQIGPFPGNTPPYLAYQLVNSRIGTESPELLFFQVQQEIPLSGLKSFLIGTDGVPNLSDAEEKTLPGREDLIGPISQFWENDRYFRNPDMVNRKLRLINQDKNVFDPISRSLLRTDLGHLPDDTTFLVGRQKQEEE